MRKLQLTVLSHAAAGESAPSHPALGQIKAAVQLVPRGKCHLVKGRKAPSFTPQMAG